MSSELINYDGQLLSLHAISAKEKVSYSVLKKYYYKCNNILVAVSMARYFKDKKDFTVSYEGDQLRLEAISRIENVDLKKLRDAFESTCDIYKAIAKIKPPEDKKGIISETAKRENLDEALFRIFVDFYRERYKSIDLAIKKAIIVTRYEQSKRSNLTLHDYQITRAELAKRVNQPILLVNDELNKRKSAQDIENEYIDNNKLMKRLLADKYHSKSLFEYCVSNNLDYTAIGRYIYVYGQLPVIAVSRFQGNNNHIDMDDIKKSYEGFLSYLQIDQNIDKELVLKILYDENCTLEQAILKSLFRSDEQLDEAEKPWLEDVYRYLMRFTDPATYNEASNACLLDQKEKDVLRDKYKKMRPIYRQLRLQDLATLIDRCSENDDKLIDYYKEYGLTADEIITLYALIYNPYFMPNEHVVTFEVQQPKLVYDDLGRLNEMYKCIKTNVENLSCTVPDTFSKEEAKYIVDRIWLICPVISKIYPDYYGDDGIGQKSSISN